MADALITGGCGFIGRHLLQALLARGERLRVLDAADPQGLPEGVEAIQGSILDPAALRVATAGVRRVYHLAGLAHLWAPDPRNFDRINQEGTVAVLRAAAAAGVERVVHCSTEAVLLPQRAARGTVIAEDVLPPLTAMAGPYTRSKHGAETAALAAAREGLDVVIASPTVPIGPGDRNLTPPAAMLRLLVVRRLAAFLDCLLNLVDVRDVATGLVLAGERGRRGERYVLGGENVPLHDLLRRVEALTGRPMPRRRIPGFVALASAVVAAWLADHVTGMRPSVTPEGVRLALRSAPFDSRKAREELGYAPRPVDEALAATIRWILEEAPSSSGPTILRSTDGPHGSPR